MLFTEDATFYAQEIREGRHTVTELVQAAINNIETMDESLNAVVHRQFDQALDLAESYDQQLRNDSSKLPPFFGVPILLKDLGHSQKGQVSTSGSKLMAGYVSPETDNFTQSIEAAGFIVVGRTNVPEFGFKNISDSDYNGRVNSPIDNNRNPGGSSGGAAAALKSGMVPIVTASDGGGSIRIPASFSGLIGLKPSRGRIPVGPGSYRGWQGASINFVLTKSVRDTWTLLKAMQVEQLEAPFIMPLIQEDELTPLTRSLKIAYSLKSPEGSELSQEARQMMIQVIEQLESLGHQVEEAEPAIDGIEAMKTYYRVNGVETAVMMEGFESALGRPLTVDDMELMSWAIYRMGLKVSGTDYSKVLSYWDELTAISESFFQDYDVLLMPATNGPAPLHTAFPLSESLQEDLKNMDDFDNDQQLALVEKMFEESLAWTPFTQQMNLTGQPAISLPMYEIEGTHLPLGTQFSTAKGGEYLLLQLAKQLEDHGMLDASITQTK
ncbi:amidase [Aerococcaceae bacterium WGS1372]